MSIPKNAPRPRRKPKKPNYNHWATVRNDVVEVATTLSAGKAFLDTAAAGLEPIEANRAAIETATKTYSQITDLMSRTNSLLTRVDDVAKFGNKINDAGRPTQIEIYERVGEITDDYTTGIVPVFVELASATDMDSGEIVKTLTETLKS